MTKAKAVPLYMALVAGLVSLPAMNLLGDTIIEETEILLEETTEEVLEEETTEEEVLEEETTEEEVLEEETTEEGVLEEELVEEEILQEELPEEVAPLIKVILPDTLNFSIDPYEVQKKGQVFSEKHIIENLSETEVTVHLNKFNLEFIGEGDFQPMSSPIRAEDFKWGGPKEAYIVLNFDRPGIAPIVFTNLNGYEEIVLHLGPAGSHDSTVTMSISGNVNVSPDKKWFGSDISLSISYNITSPFELESAKSNFDSVDTQSHTNTPVIIEEELIKELPVEETKEEELPAEEEAEEEETEEEETEEETEEEAEEETKEEELPVEETEEEPKEEDPEEELPEEKPNVEEEPPEEEPSAVEESVVEEPVVEESPIEEQAVITE